MTLEQLVVIIKAETAALEKGIDRVKSQLSSLERAADRVSGNLTKAFNNSSSGLGKLIKALSIGGLIAGLMKFGKSALDAASDLQEWQNVVDVAFGGATEDVEKFYKMAVDRFGLSEIAARKLTGTFKAMANGVGLNEAAGRKMAIQLAGLSADMASFYNTTTDVTSTALEGIFTGQGRALKQFGVVMNDATLESFRLSRGIQTAYSDMSYAEKVALRYNYVLATTANAQNDFARTSMSWANQMRQLAMNWSVLTSTVGRQLIGLLTPVVAILNKILKLAISVINAIAKVFGGQGIKGLTTSFGDAGDAAGAIGDNIGDVGDGLGKANAAAKKFKATIAGFDELEVLNSQPSSGGGGGGGSGGGGGGGGPSSEDIDSYFDLYDEEGILDNFEEFFQKIKDMMDADNWEGIGAEIAKGLNFVFKAIDDWITNIFEPFGVLWAGRIARVLNGLVDNLDWDLIGKTFADGLNAYIHIANEFYEKFNALNFAIGISTAINSWFTNVDWEGIGQYLANRLNFLGDMLYGFATTIDWQQIKDSINRALTSLWENLDVEKIKTSIGKLVGDFEDFLRSVDWYKIGHTVGEMLSEVDWIGLLKTVKDEVIWPAWKGFWDGLMSDGQNLILGTLGKIGTWFSESFWGPFAKAAFGAVGLNVLIGAARGFFKDGNDGILIEIARSFTFLAAQVPILGKPFVDAFEFLTQFQLDRKKNGLGFALKGALDGLLTDASIWKNKFVGYMEMASVDGAGAFKSFSTALKSMTGLGVGGFAALATAILSLSSAYGGLGGVIERIKKVFSDAWDVMKRVFDLVGGNEAIQRCKDAFSHLGEAFGKVYDALGKLKPLWELFFDAVSLVAGVVMGAIASVIAGIADFVGFVAEAVATIVDILITPIDAVLGWIGDFCQGIIDFFANLKYQLIGDPIIIDMWEAIKKCFTDAIDAVVNFVKTFIENLIKFFTDLWNKAVEIYTAIKDFLKTTWDNIKKYAEDTWKNIKKFLSDTWENVKKLATDTWEALKKTISDAWDAIKETTSNLWNAIWTTLSDIWEGIKSTISGALEAAKKLISDAWDSVKTTTSTIWEGIKKTVGDIWDGIKNKADTVTGKIKGFFTDAYDAIKGVWDGFGSWFSGIFDGLSGIVRRAMNSVIGVLNGIGITVPDWVPEIGGRHFGFNIPYLARGGVITSPTLAMMGEYTGARSNPEIVAPQSMIREIISQENGEMVNALYSIAKQIIAAIDDVDMSVSIGDDTIAQAANRGNNAYKRRTGKPLFSI